MTNEELIDELQAALAAGVTMRTAQIAYFKGRTRESLLTSKEAERRFDLLAAAALRLSHAQIHPPSR